MARFYAEIQGSRGRASRLGTASGGLWAHVRGWNVGVEVSCRADGERDIIEVWSTGGSNHAGARELLATVEHPAPCVRQAVAS